MKLGGAEFLLQCPGDPGLQGVRRISIGHGPARLYLCLCPWAIVPMPPYQCFLFQVQYVKIPSTALEVLYLDLAGLLSIGLPKSVT